MKELINVLMCWQQQFMQGLKATQLKDLDLAYAPPYSSAKDPVNMAGFMIDNIAKRDIKTMASGRYG